MEHCHHHNQSAGHAGHSHHATGQGMGHGSAASYLRRFWIVAVLLIPLTLTNQAVAGFLGVPVLLGGRWLGFALATIIFGFSLVFFQHAWHEIKARAYGMMTLVSVAVGAGYLFSVAATFLPGLEVEFYLEISTLIWVLLFGHYLEAKSGAAAGNALAEVAKLLPKQAHKLVNGQETDVDVTNLKTDDLVIVKPGEKVPADGTIAKGAANVDESLISGESKPVAKEEGQTVVAGSICLDGALTIRLTRVGEHSTVGQIKTLVEQAGRTKPRSQAVADKAAAVLTFVALSTAILTIIIWSLVVGEPFVFALTLAITVLVIACPHALGLAIPTVTTITTTLAVKNGFFIKDLSKIETIRQADYVMFDKTGTLTEGRFGVTNIKALVGEEEEILQIAASLEQSSSHIIGQSILAAARERGLKLAAVNDFKNLAGQGIRGQINGQEYLVGNRELVRELAANVPTPPVGTVVYVANSSQILGYVVLADAVKTSATQAVNALHRLGVKVAMLTGDNEQVAQQVAEELGIDTYFANVLPADKYKKVQELQTGGKTVLMVGDGVNDAPALTQANAGIAIGAGTDVAVEAGDVVLTESDPADVARLITLSRKVYAKMIQNLVWALGYNVVAIPAAAGVFATWGIFLRPEIGALVMSLSTVIVVANALTLKRLDLSATS